MSNQTITFTKRYVRPPLSHERDNEICYIKGLFQKKKKTFLKVTSLFFYCASCLLKNSNEWHRIV